AYTLQLNPRSAATPTVHAGPQPRRPTERHGRAPDLTRDRVAQFLDIEMSDEFVLEVPDGHSGWIDWGLYRARDFERQPDGSYLCAGEGAPLWLRCTRQTDDVIHLVDGHGNRLTHR